MSGRNFVKDALLGVAVGDAVGVPFEFKSRSQLKENPAMDMVGYGSHHQPAGTWSDDSSLTFCLAEMLSKKYSLSDLSNRFVNWKNFGYWTAHDEVFDMGIATSAAIHKMSMGIDPIIAGGGEEGDNGNGSLMRILPLLFFVREMDINKRFMKVKEVSSLTHRHIRSVISCFIYLEYALELLKRQDKATAYKRACDTVNQFLFETDTCSNNELAIFKRILSGSIDDLKEDEIKSSGYVIHTLEAALWCILNTSNYKDTVLKAVNLGSDTDTTAAVAGGLAGLIYGSELIPQEWLAKLVKRKEIEDLSERLENKLGNKNR
jgi:ADP-ribosylglycohydrolase